MLNDEVMYKLRMAVNDRDTTVGELVNVSFAFLELAMVRAKLNGTEEQRMEQCIRNWNKLCERFKDAEE